MSASQGNAAAAADDDAASVDDVDAVAASVISNIADAFPAITAVATAITAVATAFTAAAAEKKQGRQLRILDLLLSLQDGKKKNVLIEKPSLITVEDFCLRGFLFFYISTF